MEELQSQYLGMQNTHETLLREKDFKIADLEARFSSIDQQHQQNLQQLD